MLDVISIVQEVTYDELINLINESALEPGCYYKITDYRTTHYILMYDLDIGSTHCLDSNDNPIKNDGAVEPLTVLAKDFNKLSHEAYSDLYPQDKISYDWNPNNWLNDVGFSYNNEIIPQFKGVIYNREDTMRNISICHDWRNVLNRRWKFNYPVWDLNATYSKGDKVQLLSPKSVNT